MSEQPDLPLDIQHTIEDADQHRKPESGDLLEEFALSPEDLPRYCPDCTGPLTPTSVYAGDDHPLGVRLVCTTTHDDGKRAAYIYDLGTNELFFEQARNYHFLSDQDATDSPEGPRELELAVDDRVLARILTRNSDDMTDGEAACMAELYKWFAMVIEERLDQPAAEVTRQADESLDLDLSPIDDDVLDVGIDSSAS